MMMRGEFPFLAKGEGETDRQIDRPIAGQRRDRQGGGAIFLVMSEDGNETKKKDKTHTHTHM